MPSCGYKPKLVLNELRRRIVDSISFVMRKRICETKALLESCLETEWNFGGYVLSEIQLAHLYFSFGKGNLLMKHLNQLHTSIELAISHAFSSIAGDESTRVVWLEKLVNGFWLEPFCSYAGLVDCIHRLPDFTFHEIQCYRLRDIRLLMFAFQVADLLRYFNLGFGLSADYSEAMNVESKLKVFRLCYTMLTAVVAEETLLTKRPSATNVALSLWSAQIILEVIELLFGDVLTNEFYSVCTQYPPILFMLNNLMSIINDGMLASSQLFSPSSPTVRQLELAQGLGCKMLSGMVTSAATFCKVYSELNRKSVEVMKNAKWQRQAVMINLHMARYLKNCGEFEKCALLYKEVLFDLRKDEWLPLYRMVLAEAEDVLIHYSELLSFEFTSFCLGDSSSDFSPNGQLAERRWLNESCKTDLLAIAAIENRSKCSRGDQVVLDGFEIAVKVSNQLSSQSLEATMRMCSQHFQSDDEMLMTRCAHPFVNLEKAIGHCCCMAKVSCILQEGSSSHGPFVLSKPTQVALKSGYNEVIFSTPISHVGLYLPDHIHIESEWGSLTYPLERSVAKATVFRCAPPKCHLTLPNRDKNEEFIFGGMLQSIVILMERVHSSCSTHNVDYSVHLEGFDHLLQFQNPSTQVLEHSIVLCPTVCSHQLLSYGVNVYCPNPIGGKRSLSVNIRFGKLSFELPLIVRPMFDCLSSLKMVSADVALFSITFINRCDQTIYPSPPHIRKRTTTASEGTFELINGGMKPFQPLCPNTVVWKLNNFRSVRVGMQLSYTISGSERRYTYEANFDLKTPTVVEAYGTIVSDASMYRVGCFYEFVVSLKCSSRSLRCAKVLLWLIDEMKDCWTFCRGNETQLAIFDANGLSRTTFNIAPAVAGYLPLPNVQMEVDSSTFPNVVLCYRSKGKQVHVIAADRQRQAK
ncbi:hypothetical protein M514_09586 [Trichuris suis]|uniref:Uncharacterized protein n=1 Tax=Trichuris suis TaxID=68888 RepID=A0A085N427_9BILA|nr:hypothetical protein M514_09586 [Trichuris suis]